MAKGILAKPYVPIKTNAKYTDALANSKLLYQCESWPRFSKGHGAQLQAQYMRGYRAAARCGSPTESSNHYTDEWVLLQVERSPLHEVVRTRRLRYFAAVLTRGPIGLRALLDCMWHDDDSWVGQLQEDFAWLRGCLREPALPEHDDIDCWCT